MKRVALTTLGILCAYVVYAQVTRGTPSQLRVAVDANGLLLVNAGAQTEPITRVQFSTARLAVDANGQLLISCSDCGGSGGAPTDATYITQTPNGELSAEQALSALSSGIMRVATATGVVTSLTTSAGISANISDETGTSLLVFNTSPTLVTPILGTPQSITLTNGTGLPIGGITGLGTGVGTWLATPSSANLAAAVTDETGTGALTFATNPTITLAGSPTLTVAGGNDFSSINSLLLNNGDGLSGSFRMFGNGGIQLRANRFGVDEGWGGDLSVQAGSETQAGGISINAGKFSNVGAGAQIIIQGSTTTAAGSVDMEADALNVFGNNTSQVTPSLRSAFVSSDGTAGVTVTNCTGFKDGICISGT